MTTTTLLVAAGPRTKLTAVPHKHDDGWESDSSAWRVDLSVHFRCNGMVSCTLLPIRCSLGSTILPRGSDYTPVQIAARSGLASTAASALAELAAATKHRKATDVCATAPKSPIAAAPPKAAITITKPTPPSAPLPAAPSSAMSIEQLLTVVITSSPVRSNPSTRMLLECLTSLDIHGDLSQCRKLIMCDGFKVREQSQRKLGIVTDEEAVLYREYIQSIACMCREKSSLQRTRVVQLAKWQGSAYAIREAIEGHVQTPFVIIVPHDCIIARPVRLDAVVAMMHANADRVNYVKIGQPKHKDYAEAVCARVPRSRLGPHGPSWQRLLARLVRSPAAWLRVLCVQVLSRYGVRLEPTPMSTYAPSPSLGAVAEASAEMSLTPMLCYKDNIAMVSVRFLTEHVFTPSSGVRRGTFIEDTFGKNFQMRSWLVSAACAAKQPPSNGCFLLGDGRAEPMIRHLDGKTYLDPEQRVRAGLKAHENGRDGYIDWTVTLRLASLAAQQETLKAVEAAEAEEAAEAAEGCAVEDDIEDEGSEADSETLDGPCT
jgi:hypothetical protein